MRRPARGATRGPQNLRPGTGFGRPVRPRPPEQWRNPAALATLRSWDPVELLIATATTGDDALVTP